MILNGELVRSDSTFTAPIIVEGALTVKDLEAGISRYKMR